tara:strand:- start:605 stop:1459 length:855 start_codon:yes stop_codon:yes gene_type:complete
MPDWKKLEDYAYTDKLDGPGWAWEFLRRNENFIADYEAFKNGNLTDVNGKLPISFKDTQLENFGGIFFLEPSLQGGQSVKNWIKEFVLNGQYFKFRTPEQFLAYKWGLERVVPNPSKNALEVKIAIKFENEYPFPKVLRFLEDIDNVPLENTSDYEDDVNGEWPTEFRRDRIILEFTLTEAFQPQIDRIETEWKKRRKNYLSNPLPFESVPENKKKPHKSVLARRLRVIDADVQSPEEEDYKKQEIIYEADPSGNSPGTHYNDRKAILEKANRNGYLELSRILA